MSGPSKIEWTEQTWNPIVGCSIVSPGCTNCYAMKMAARIEAMGNQPRYAGTTKKVNGNAVWTGKLAHAPESTLLEPLRRKKPTTYFVNSMGDLFHEDVPDEWIDRVFAVMALAPQHTFQVLTKRADRMRAHFAGESQKRIVKVSRGGNPSVTVSTRKTYHSTTKVGGDWTWPLSNVWLGVSAERQQEYDERKQHLRSTPAAVRFFSMEPLLGPIVADYLGDWVIVGGESGTNARPAHPDWYRALRDQCAAAGVPFFFKQFGEWGMPTDTLGALDWPYHPDHDRTHWFDARTCARPTERGWSDKYHDAGSGAQRPPPFDLWKTPEYLDQIERCPQAACGNAGKCQGNNARAAVTRVGKKAAGRLLDGVEHNGFPSRGTI